MYDDPRFIKDNPIKFKVDDFTRDEFEDIKKLSNKQRATIAREIFEMGMNAWHEKYSIGLGEKQKDLFNEQLKA